MLRIGNGFDSHRLEFGYKLILGGVQIDFEKGLKGHSDADVLTHAIIDALLGAASMPDIGELFPPSNEIFKNINSLLLLQKVHSMLQKENWQIINLDCILICEKPKISAYKKDILASLALALQIDQKQINLKAKTAEQMGALGRQEGIASLVVALIEQKPSLG